jgi:hypothetical protein
MASYPIAEVAGGSVALGRNIEPLDEAAHHHPRISLGAETATVQPRALEDDEDCFGHAVAVGAFDRAGLRGQKTPISS